MTTCHGCSQPLEPLAQVRQYHTACDPMGRVEMLERALEECAAPYVIGNRDAIHFEQIAREFNRRQRVAGAALAYRLAQMKGREG